MFKARFRNRRARRLRRFWRPFRFFHDRPEGVGWYAFSSYAIVNDIKHSVLMEG